MKRPRSYQCFSFRMTVVEGQLLTPVDQRYKRTIEPRRMHGLRLPFLFSLLVLGLPVLRTHQARALFGGAFHRFPHFMPELRRTLASARVGPALPPDQ